MKTSFNRARPLALFLALALGVFTLPVLADEDGCQGNCPSGDTYNEGGEGGDGYGLGIGIGKGGNAKAYGGNAYSKGGNARSNANSRSNSRSKSESNSRSSSASKSSSYQQQGQIGILKNVGPQVVITDESTVVYEAPIMPAGSPDLSQAAPTAACIKTWSVSGGVTAAIGIGGGASGYVWDEICGLWTAARETTGTAREAAGKAAFCMTLEKAGVEDATCDSWTEKQDALSAAKVEKRGERAASTEDFTRPEDRS